MKTDDLKSFVIPPLKYKSLRDTMRGQPINSNLLVLRSMTDHTINELSKKIDINRETYSNYEKGRCQVPSDIILRLADLYEIPIDLIYGRTEKQIVKNFYCSNKKNQEVRNEK